MPGSTPAKSKRRSSPAARKRAESAQKLRKGRAGIEFSPRSRGRPGRSRRLRIRRALLLVAALLAAALCVEMAYALFTSHRFALRDTEVEGADAAAVPLILELAPPPGPNLFSLSKKEIAARISALSFVEAATLHRRPPGKLIVRVRERQPVAFLSQNNQSVYVDASRIAFLHPSDMTAGLIELRGFKISQEEIGCPISSTLGLAVCKGMSALLENSYFKVKVLEADSKGWLTAHLASGTKLRLGAPENLATKLEKAEAAHAFLNPAQPAEYFDFSSPDAPVWKPGDAIRAKPKALAAPAQD